MRRLARWLETIHDPPLFLNGVSGLGTPWMVPSFPSRFLGGGARPARRDVPARAAAVAESILFLAAANLERMRAGGIAVRRLVATGGLSRIGPLCARLADLAGVAAVRPAQAEATARGVAGLAGGMPPGWGIGGGAAWFRQRRDDALQDRYRRWRAAMDEALR